MHRVSGAPQAWRIAHPGLPATAVSNCAPTRWSPGSAIPAPGCNGVAIPRTRCHGHRLPRVAQACVGPPPFHLALEHGTEALPLRRSCKPVQKKTRRDRLPKQPPASEQQNPHLPHVLLGVALLPDISVRAASCASLAGKGSDIPRATCTAETPAGARDFSADR